MSMGEHTPLQDDPLEVSERALRAKRSPYRELELLFQASRTSPMLHEAAVTVEEYLRALEEAQQFPVETVMSWKRRANQVYDEKKILVEQLEATQRREQELRDAMADYLDAENGYAMGSHDDPQLIEQALTRLRGLALDRTPDVPDPAKRPS